MNINKALVAGNLTRDPELRTTQSGVPVASFTIATNRITNGKDGQKEEQVEFHSIIAFGKTAELVKQYLTKGRLAFVEGRLQTRSFEKDGVKHYRTEVIADNVQFGPRPEASERTSPSPDFPDGINPDDIPF